MQSARDALGAAVGSDGRIYAIGGHDSSDRVSLVEAYVPGAPGWTTVASMPTARDYLAVVSGNDGRIYAIGGYDAPNDLAVVEAYTP
jgi:hypothetical protein